MNKIFIDNANHACSYNNHLNLFKCEDEYDDDNNNNENSKDMTNKLYSLLFDKLKLLKNCSSNFSTTTAAVAEILFWLSFKINLLWNAMIFINQVNNGIR